MPILNLNESNSLYYGSIQAQKLYKGNQLLHPIAAVGFLYWRVDYNRILAEIQVSFNNLNTPIPLNSTGITFSRLPPPYSTLTTTTYNNISLLIDNNFTSNQYVGSANLANNEAYQILFNTQKNITSLWLAPQLGPVNLPSYLRLYNSNDGNNWILQKEWTTLGLISGQLKQFVV